MGSLDKIIRLANRFSRKLSLAQQRTQHIQSAQPSEIDKVLYSAGVRPTDKELEPFLDQAHVPGNAHLSIGINVEPNMKVTFSTLPKYISLENLLNHAYAAKMQSALQAANTAPTAKMYVELVKF